MSSPAATLLSFSFTDTNKYTDSHFQGWKNATLPLPVNTVWEREERGRGEGWDKIHQIWWHGDVDNVFSFQLSSEKRRQNITTFTLSYPLFWMKGSTMYWVCVSNMCLCAQTLCPSNYQNDCPTIMWFNGKIHILLILLQAGLIFDRKKKNIINQFLICLHKYDRNPLKNCSTPLENKCVQEM